MFIKVILLLAILAGVVALTGCAGVRFSAELDRVDESQQSSASHPVPLKCLFVDCGGKAS